MCPRFHLSTAEKWRGDQERDEQKQVAELQTEAERLKNEITELTGEDVPGV